MPKFELFLGSDDLDVGQENAPPRFWGTARKMFEWPFLPPPGYMFRFDSIDMSFEVTGAYEGKIDDPKMVTTIFIEPVGPLAEEKVRILQQNGWEVDLND